MGLWDAIHVLFFKARVMCVPFRFVGIVFVACGMVGCGLFGVFFLYVCWTLDAGVIGGYLLH